MRKGVSIVQSQDPLERRRLGRPSGPSASQSGAAEGVPRLLRGSAWFFIFLFPMRSLRNWKKKKTWKKKQIIYKNKPRVSRRGFHQCQGICLERLFSLVIGKGPVNFVGQYSAVATFQVGLEFSFLIVSLATNFLPIFVNASCFFFSPYYFFFSLLLFLFLFFSSLLLLPLSLLFEIRWRSERGRKKTRLFFSSSFSFSTR